MKRITQIKNSTKKIFLLEGSTPGQSGATTALFPWQQSCHYPPMIAKVGATKGTKGQAVFFDGHAEMYDITRITGIQDLTSLPTYGGFYYNLDSMTLWRSDDITN